MADQRAISARGPLVIPLPVGKPKISADAFIAPNATLLGDVIIGQEASVYYGAVLRADAASIKVGKRSNVQDNVVVHCDPRGPCGIGARVSVGHGAVLHGCTIEDVCLIGMGSVIMNGALIGGGSIVAAGSVVLEGALIPPRSMVVGTPGKVYRSVTDDELASIRQNADHYVEFSALHRAATTRTRHGQS